jgi:hypothetical protein
MPIDSIPSVPASSTAAKVSPMYMRSASRQPKSLAGQSIGLTLAIALAGLLALRIVGLWFNQTDLFFDEAQYWSWGKEPAFGYYSKPR